MKDFDCDWCKGIDPGCLKCDGTGKMDAETYAFDAPKECMTLGHLFLFAVAILVCWLFWHTIYLALLK